VNRNLLSTSSPNVDRFWKKNFTSKLCEKFTADCVIGGIFCAPGLPTTSQLCRYITVYYLVTNFPTIVPVKTFQKSVNSGQKLQLTFWTTL